MMLLYFRCFRLYIELEVQLMSYEKIAQLNQQRVIVGKKETVRASQNNALQKVIIAKDATETVTKPVLELAEELSAPCTYVDSTEQLGKACGIDVGTSTVGIKRH